MVNSVTFYRQLRIDLGDWFRDQGFTRSRRTSLGWWQAPLLVWIQKHPHGWNPYTGGTFHVNVQLGADTPGDGSTRRLVAFLTDRELESVRDIHNAVVSKLRLPPLDRVHAVTKGDLSRFTPIAKAIKRDHDFALSYWDVDDLAEWSRFLLTILPRIVSTLEL